MLELSVNQHRMIKCVLPKIGDKLSGTIFQKVNNSAFVDCINKMNKFKALVKPKKTHLTQQDVGSVIHFEVTAVRVSHVDLSCIGIELSAF